MARALELKEPAPSVSAREFQWLEFVEAKFFSLNSKHWSFVDAILHARNTITTYIKVLKSAKVSLPEQWSGYNYLKAKLNENVEF